ncbi:MAG: bifunctional hydroxymethylpyrimidine kinase/phosphomethylpyrimidine kinase, partial [Deltaproteobacteria bacterium]
HLEGPPADLLWSGGRPTWFAGRRVPGRDMHGGGCAFASAVAAALACGLSLEEAVRRAGRHVRALIAAAQRTRQGAWLRAGRR